MHISPDEEILWQTGLIKINVTIVTTWVIMAILMLASRIITRKLSKEVTISRWQSVLEMLVIGIQEQLAEVGLQKPERYTGFIGTLFLFIAMANLCTIIPYYEPPTSSLSTTAALAICVFGVVPFFGIRERGIRGYLKSYLQPTFIMLPFNIISEVSRTLALAIRLFGNMMSGTMIISILLTITPLIFPVIMNILGLLTGMVQAYIFSILTAVFIAAATSDEDRPTKT